jgi:hypothetical protein
MKNCHSDTQWHFWVLDTDRWHTRGLAPLRAVLAKAKSDDSIHSVEFGLKPDGMTAQHVVVCGLI